MWAFLFVLCVVCVVSLFQVVKEHMPNEAATVFEKCVHEKALALSGKVRTIELLLNSIEHYCIVLHTIECYGT